MEQDAAASAGDAAVNPLDGESIPLEFVTAEAAASVGLWNVLDPLPYDTEQIEVTVEEPLVLHIAAYTESGSLIYFSDLGSDYSLNLNADSADFTLDSFFRDDSPGENDDDRLFVLQFHSTGEYTVTTNLSGLETEYHFEVADQAP